jgi:predicted cobalt transporter CbtA
MSALAAAVAQLFSSLSTSAAKRRARLSLAPGAAVPLSPNLPASAAQAIRRRRSELVWYLATAVLAIGVGVLATVWLNQA